MKKKKRSGERRDGVWVRQSATGQLRERMLLRQRKMEDKQMLAEGREAEDGERKEKNKSERMKQL